MTYTEGLITMIGAIVAILAVVVGAIWRAASNLAVMTARSVDLAKDLERHTVEERQLRVDDRISVNARFDVLTATVSRLQLEMARMSGRLDDAGHSGSP